MDVPPSIFIYFNDVFSPQTGSELFQHLGRRPERETGLFEHIDNFFDARLLVVKSHNRDVGIVIDLRFFDVRHVFESPPDPLPREGSLAVRQQESDNTYLRHGRRGADQNGEKNGNQHQMKRSGSHE
jgi:hypothetical protein